MKLQRIVNSTIKTTPLLLVFLIAWSCESRAAERAVENDNPKGVILIVIDDIGYGDIDILYPSDLETPSIDSLCQQSVRLTDFHVGTTCAPSRASLLTGRYVNAGGVWHTIAGRELLRENEQTVAEVFQANGWRTGIFGKWHLGEGNPFWPRFRGFDVSVIHGAGGIGQSADFWQNDYYSGVDFAGNATKADTYFHQGQPVEADKFCTDYWFDNAKSFIEDSLEKQQPFFCYIPTNAAHGPFNAPHGFKEGFDGLIENIDANLRQLDEYLEDKGIKDDVMLVFTSDNGTAKSRSGGLRGKKGSYYDGGHNVPCFVRWKNGGIAGSVDSSRDVNALTAGMDWMPTFIDMFGLERPEGGLPLHGVSLKSYLTDPDSKPASRTIVVDTQRARNLVRWKRACVMHDEVVEGEILHKWRLNRLSIDVEKELFDFKVDRDTSEDLAQQHSQKVNLLSAAYDEWWDVVSKGAESYPSFVVDPEKESELILYAHSWIGQNGSPWHQNGILNGAPGSRVLPIQFDMAGRYQFELRRWPREDGGLIAGKTSSGRGKEFPVVSARLEIEGVGEVTAEVGSDSPAVLLEMDVPAGEATRLTTSFLDENNKILLGAYYVYIRKVGQFPADNR